MNGMKHHASLLDFIYSVYYVTEGEAVELGQRYSGDFVLCDFNIFTDIDMIKNIIRGLPEEANKIWEHKINRMKV